MKTRTLKFRTCLFNYPGYLTCTPTKRWKIEILNGECTLFLEVVSGGGEKPFWAPEWDLEIEEKEIFINDCSC